MFASKGHYDTKYNEKFDPKLGPKNVQQMEKN